MKNLLKISSGHLFSEIVRITLLKLNFFLTAGIIFFQMRNLMVTLNLKLCFTVSRGGWCMKNLLKISSGHLFSEIVRITLLKFNFFLTAGIIFFQIRNLMVTLNLKLCLTVSRGEWCMKNLLKISSGHLFSEIVRITLLKFNFF